MAPPTERGGVPLWKRERRFRRPGYFSTTDGRVTAASKGSNRHRQVFGGRPSKMPRHARCGCDAALLSHAAANRQIMFCCAARPALIHPRSTRQPRCRPGIAGGAPSDAVGVMLIGGS
jgi:hypothetical protein